MADVTREVLIKLKVQQLPFRMRTPDVSGAQRAATQIETVYKTAYSNIAAAANSVTNVRFKGIDVSAFQAAAKQAGEAMRAELTLIETQVDRINTKLGAMATGLSAASAGGAGGTASESAPEKAGQAAAEMRRSYQRQFRLIAEDYRQMQIEMGKVGVGALRLEAVNAKLAVQRSLLTPVTQGVLQAGEGYKRAAEGAFHLARGIALLNYENEAELAVLLKKLAYYQGLFDIARGGQDVIKGLYDGTKNLRGAYLAAAAAASVNGTSIGVMSVAMNYATASATAMWTAVTGPIGLTIIGLTAVATVATVAWYKYGNAGKDAADKAAEALAKQAEAARIARYDIEKLTQAIQRQKNFEGGTASRASILEVQQGQRQTYVKANVDAGMRAQEKEVSDAGLKDIEAKLAANRDAAAKQRAAFVETAARQANVRNTDNFIGQNAGISAQGFSTFDPKKFKGGFAQSLGDNQAEYTKLQARLKAIANAPAPRFTDNVKAQEASLTIMNRQAELQKTIKTQAEAAVKSERDRLALLGEQRTAVQQIIDKEKARYEANKQALRDEENKRKSAVQKFGELRPDQQEQLKALGQQIKTGGISSLNEGQIQQLRDSGFGQSILSKRDYAKGTAAGGDDFLKDIGEFKPGNTTNLEEGQGADETKADYLKRMQADAKAEIAKRESQMAQIVQESQGASTTLVKLAGQLADMQPLIDAFQTAIAKRDKQIENLKAENERVKSSDQKAQDARVRSAQIRGGMAGGL